jgi:hypothetical protein
VASRGHQRQDGVEKLHHDHRKANREHAAWKRDLERWRASYSEALMACARRLARGLELENFEAALDRHEAASWGLRREPRSGCPRTPSSSTS